MICPNCKGNGVTRIQQGFFIMEQTCQKCGGEGHIIANPCKSCSGTGLTSTPKKVEVNIPAGIEHGSSVKIQGAGEDGERGGSAGDLYVVVNIKENKYFKREGLNLHTEIPIKFTRAALGGQVDVYGLDKKKISFNIPKGTQTGQSFVIKGEGFPVLNRIDKRGDFIVTVGIETPVKLTPQQEELLKKFEDISNPDSHPKEEGFLDSIKKFFS
jgi:molecular chaperone DnaJ